MDTRLWHDQNPAYLKEPDTILQARQLMNKLWNSHNEELDDALSNARMEQRDSFSHAELDRMELTMKAWLAAKASYDTAWEQECCIHDWVEDTTGGQHYNGNEVYDDVVTVTMCKLCLKVKED